MKVRTYALRLLRDQSGVWWWVPLVVSFGLSFVGQTLTGSSGKRGQRHARERSEALAREQVMAQQENDIEAIKEMQKLEEARLATFKASSFQKGSYTGPYFQMVSK